MKKTTIITVACFVLGLIVLTMGFILLTDNNISNKIFAPKETTTTTTAKPNTNEPVPEYDPMVFFDMDMTQYVTLGQYKDLVIEADKVEASDEEVDFEIYKVMCVAGDITKLYEGTVISLRHGSRLPRKSGWHLPRLLVNCHLSNSL